MDAVKYLTGIEMQPIGLQPDSDTEIAGFEIRFQWVVLETQAVHRSEPMVIDEESLLGIMASMRRHIEEARSERPGTKH